MQRYKILQRLEDALAIHGCDELEMRRTDYGYVDVSFHIGPDPRTGHERIRDDGVINPLAVCETIAESVQMICMDLTNDRCKTPEALAKLPTEDLPFRAPDAGERSFMGLDHLQDGHALADAIAGNPVGEGISVNPFG